MERGGRVWRKRKVRTRVRWSGCGGGVEKEEEGGKENEGEGKLEEVWRRRYGEGR